MMLKKISQKLSLLMMTKRSPMIICLLRIIYSTALVAILAYILLQMKIEQTCYTRHLHPLGLTREEK